MSMYRPPMFRVDDPSVLREFVAQHPLAALITMGGEGIENTLIPMFFADTATGEPRVYGHIARANRQWQRFDPSVDAVALFVADAHYISPTWYASTARHGRMVPTYNYVTVEVRGKARFFEDARELRVIVERLTDVEEGRVGAQWRVEDAPADYIDAQLRGIIGVEITVGSMHGAFKLSQNREQEDYESVLAGLGALGTPQSRAVAELIRAYRP